MVAAHRVPRAARLEQALSELRSQCPDMEAASVVTFDGLPMAASLPEGMDEERVAAMCAALLSLGERASEGLGRGLLEQVSIDGETGSVHLVSAADEAVLVGVVPPSAKTGLVLFEMRRAAADIAAILGDTDALPTADVAAAPAEVLEAPSSPSTAAGTEPVVPAQFASASVDPAAGLAAGLPAGSLAGSSAGSLAGSSAGSLAGPVEWAVDAASPLPAAPSWG